MGAIQTFAAWLAAIKSPHQIIPFPKSAWNSFPAAPLGSGWARNPVATLGAAPTAPVVPAQTLIGALGQSDAYPGSSLWLTNSRLGFSGKAVIMLCDRLSHQGGLVGNSSGVQTVNLPTAALTRYTDGVGVFAGLEIYSSFGGTIVTCTASYTNDTGGAATTQATQLVVARQVATALTILPLAQGDRGVRAVSDFTLSATTGAVGNAGITLFRPLAMFAHTYPQDAEDFNGLIGACGNIPQILNGACLFMCSGAAIDVQNSNLAAEFSFTEA